MEHQGAAPHWSLHTPEICLRIPLLYVLDMILNGSVAMLVIQELYGLNVDSLLPTAVNDTAFLSNVTVGATDYSQTISVALFHPNRVELVNRIWRRLPVRHFILGSLLQMCAVVTLTCLAVLPARRLMQFYRWAIPNVALCLSAYSNHYLMTVVVPSAIASTISFRDLLGASAVITTIDGLLLAVYLSGRMERFTGMARWLHPLSVVAFLGYVIASPLAVLVTPIQTVLLIMTEYTHIPLIVHEFEGFSRALSAAVVAVRRILAELRNQADNLGVRLAIDEESLRLILITTMRVFFVMRSMFYVTYLFTEAYLAGKVEPNPLTSMVWSNSTYVNVTDDSGVSMPTWKVAVAYLGVRSCDTVVAVLSTTAVVSEVGQYLTDVFMYVLDAPHNEDSDTSGAVLGVLFVMLALQSSITTIDPQKRLLRLYRTMILQLTALLHMMGRILDDAFQRLSAVGTRFSFRTSARLLMCSAWIMVLIAALIRFLLVDGTGAWSSPWILSVTLFSGEVIVRVTLSFCIFLMNLKLNNQQLHPEELERMESKIFFVKTAGSMIELTIGVLLLINGVFILATDYGGLIRLVLMSLHAYGNVWLQAQEIHATYRRRRDADAQISQLTTASRAELMVLGDRCSICQEDMVAVAKRTACGHYFHAGCLKRWLYVQEVCPNCHTPIQRPASQATVPAW